MAYVSRDDCNPTKLLCLFRRDEGFASYFRTSNYFYVTGLSRTATLTLWRGRICCSSAADNNNIITGRLNDSLVALFACNFILLSHNELSLSVRIAGPWRNEVEATLDEKKMGGRCRKNRNICLLTHLPESKSSLWYNSNSKLICVTMLGLVD